MGVEQDGGQRRSIDAEYLVVGNLAGQFGVKSMDAFKYKYFVAPELQFLAALLALARLEIVARQLNFLATHERVHLLIEQRQVEGVKVFEVVVAILVLGGLLAVEEVVVEGNADRVNAVDSQLYGESLARRCLTATAGTGYEHHLDTLLMGYLVGYLGYLLLLQGFAELDEGIGMTVLNSAIKVANCAHAQQVLPAMVLLEDFKHLVLTHEGS